MLCRYLGTVDERAQWTGQGPNIRVLSPYCCFLGVGDLTAVVNEKTVHVTMSVGCYVLIEWEL